jgi:hypothetical protein
MSIAASMQASERINNLFDGFICLGINNKALRIAVLYLVLIKA